MPSVPRWALILTPFGNEQMVIGVGTHGQRLMNISIHGGSATSVQSWLTRIAE